MLNTSLYNMWHVCVSVSGHRKTQGRAHSKKLKAERGWAGKEAIHCLYLHVPWIMAQSPHYSFGLDYVPHPNVFVEV